MAFQCIKYSDFFRHIMVDIDYSLDNLLLPIFDTTSHPNRSVELPERQLSVFTPLEDAGIQVTFNKKMTSKIEDPDPSTPWTLSELYEAMLSHQDKDPTTWNVWILLAPKYRDPRTAGLMFDRKNRKGFALFMDHKWFRDMNLAAGNDKIKKKKKAAAIRRFVHTFVHEMGHTFNLQHAWEKGKPDSVSFMNSDYRYDTRNGVGSYFREFKFMFDEDEIRFLRHGRPEWVQPGVSPFGRDLPASSLPADPDDSDQVSKRLTLTLKPSKESYTQMEVVRVELKLQNQHKYPVYVESSLDLSQEWVRVFITCPDGGVVQADTFANGAVANHIKALYPAGSEEGSDRVSEVIPLVYGKDGFYFKEPGKYYIKAIYTFGSYYVVSVLARINIIPFAGENAIVDAFFTEEIGEYIAIGGSGSVRYRKARELINRLATSEEHKVWAGEIAVIASDNLSHSTRKSFTIDGTAVSVSREDGDALAKDVIKSTQIIADNFHIDGTQADNIMYRKTVFLRAQAYLKSHYKVKAQSEVRRLIADLKSRGVKDSIIQEMENEWLILQGDHVNLSLDSDPQRRALWNIITPTVKELQQRVKDILFWQANDDSQEEDECEKQTLQSLCYPVCL
uniref:Uncharacterized protein LOC102809481 n=1 Tax=Saccoglossus kowalevskii TaxID=10224 RepID=A0ABM0M6E9_SACKO|nr:PREDICTED: uncharacterized protein LOC102809481 [Saccoglossus kowalevskii]